MAISIESLFLPMALWEYKVLTSGALGFGSATLLEQHLNQLGQEQWEIISWQTAPNNPLVFQGLARRPILRDWFPETSEMTRPLRTDEPVEEKTTDDDARELLQDPDDADDGDELPSLFDALRPHLRRNKHGGGWSVEVGYLAKKFEQDEGELLEAFTECGLPPPTDASEKPTYVESDGWLYWLNRDQRGQVWVNAKDKPKDKPKSRDPEPAKPAPVVVQPSARVEAAPAPALANKPAPTQAVSVPAIGDGQLLDKLRVMMRRNRRGYGYSGNVSFLARAMNQDPTQLMNALVALGVREPADQNDRTPGVEWNGNVYWLNKNQGGQLWLNGRPKKSGSDRAEQPPAEGSRSEESTDEAVPSTSDETVESPAPREWKNPFAEETPGAEVAPQVVADETPSEPASTAVPSLDTALAGLRLLLKKKKTGTGVAGQVSDLAEQLGKTEAELMTTLDQLGLRLPISPKGKPSFIDHAGEVYWLNQNAKGEIWLNAKEQTATAVPVPKKAAAGAKKPKAKKKGD